MLLSENIPLSMAFVMVGYSPRAASQESAADGIKPASLQAQLTQFHKQGVPSGHHMLHMGLTAVCDCNTVLGLFWHFAVPQ